MIKNENERITVTLTKKEIEQIEKIATKQGVSKSIVIKLALADYIKASKK